MFVEVLCLLTGQQQAWLWLHWWLKTYKIGREGGGGDQREEEERGGPKWRQRNGRRTGRWCNVLFPCQLFLWQWDDFLYLLAKSKNWLRLRQKRQHAIGCNCPLPFMHLFYSLVKLWDQQKRMCFNCSYTRGDTETCFKDHSREAIGITMLCSNACHQLVKRRLPFSLTRTITHCAHCLAVKIPRSGFLGCVA